MIQQAVDLITGPLVGAEWKRACIAFQVAAREELKTINSKEGNEPMAQPNDHIPADDAFEAPSTVTADEVYLTSAVAGRQSPLDPDRKIDIAARYVAAMFAGRASADFSDKDRVLRAIVRTAHRLAEMTLQPHLAEPTVEDMSAERTERLTQLREHRKQVLSAIEGLTDDAPTDYVDKLHNLSAELREEIKRLEGDA